MWKVKKLKIPLIQDPSNFTYKPMFTLDFLKIRNTNFSVNSFYFSNINIYNIHYSTVKIVMQKIL